MKSQGEAAIRKPELLAPAGGIEAACAALRYGADAIYLGMSSFSARAEAENFTPDSLEEVVGLAHSLTPARRVYVAVNTLILQREIPDVVRLLGTLSEQSVDAVIVQDLGILRIARTHFPKLRLHASTQMAAHNLQGARALARLGFARVTLARELSLDEVRDIGAKCGIETEVFAHGALCYSYSGLCLFSSHALGRSGNRGRCAYCCRETYTAMARDGSSMFRGLPFSMNDLALDDLLPGLCRARVTGLKIEGRMKSALYVAAATDYYRRALDGTLSARDAKALKEDMKTIFSRPWTRLYTTPGPRESVIDPVNVGHRGAAIGTVVAVRRDRLGFWIQFSARRALEKHDGLQIDLPSSPRPFGFAVEKMRLAGKRPDRPDDSRVTVPADSEVEVLLPGGHPTIPVGATVYCSSSQAVKRRYKWPRLRSGEHRRRKEIDVCAAILPESLTVRASVRSKPEISAEVSLGGKFEPAQTPERTEAAFRQSFERMKDTEWRLGGLTLEDKDRLFVPPPLIHQARRDLARLMSERHGACMEEGVQSVISALNPAPSGQAVAPARIEWSLKLRDPALLGLFEQNDLENLSEVVFLPPSPWEAKTIRSGLDSLVARVGRGKVRIAIPAIIRASEARVTGEAIKSLRSAGYERWEIANVGGADFLAESADSENAREPDLSADWSMHALNCQAADQLWDMGIRRFVFSPEDDKANLSRLIGAYGSRAEVLLFQYTPLFVSETAPQIGSGKPALSTRIMSHEGDCYYLRRDGARTVVVSDKPFSLSRHRATLEEAGARRFRLDFSWGPEKPEDALRIWRQVLNGDPIADSHDANFRRGLA